MVGCWVYCRYQVIHVKKHEIWNSLDRSFKLILLILRNKYSKNKLLISTLTHPTIIGIKRWFVLNKSVAFWSEHRAIAERLATSKQHAFLTLTESQSALQSSTTYSSKANSFRLLQQPKLFAQSGSNSTTSKYRERDWNRCSRITVSQCCYFYVWVLCIVYLCLFTLKIHM